MNAATLARWSERARTRIEERFAADDASPIQAFKPGWSDGWRRTGSAGQASRWFELALTEHPFEPAAVVASLARIIEEHLAKSPRHYTRRHLNQLLAIVSEEAGFEHSESQPGLSQGSSEGVEERG